MKLIKRDVRVVNGICRGIFVKVDKEKVEMKKKDSKFTENSMHFD